MKNNSLPENHPAVVTGKTGILLLSLGTPDAPTYGAVRRYLAEFLSDPRVIETPKLIWLPILYGAILTLRPLKAAKAYASIWNKDRNESPLRTYARSQAEKLSKRMAGEAEVAWAFRYGQPAVADGIEELKAKGCDRLVLFALYPQYSATSMATAYDKAFDVLKTLRWQPAIRTVGPYYENPAYIEKLATSVRSSLAGLDWEPDILQASYHSIPKSYFDKGDPYPCQCRKTSRLLREALSWDESKFVTSFQSRVGPTEWVKPYTDKMVEQLAAEGVKKLAILAPAFSADCLETLEEINMELRETFLAAGGTHFHYIPCLNDSNDGMYVLETVVRAEAGNWL